MSFFKSLGSFVKELASDAVQELTGQAKAKFHSNTVNNQRMEGGRSIPVYCLRAGKRAESRHTKEQYIIVDRDVADNAQALERIHYMIETNVNGMDVVTGPFVCDYETLCARWRLSSIMYEGC